MTKETIAALAILGLAACSTQPSGSGAANATINANCPMWSTGAAMGGPSSAERRSCVVVVTQSSPVTAMPTSTISPSVSIPSPSIP